AALAVAGSTLAADGRDGHGGRRGGYSRGGHDSHSHRDWGSRSYGHDHYGRVRRDDCGPSFIFRFEPRPIVIHRPVVCDPPIIYRRAPVCDTPVVIHRPVIIEQPAPIIIQQPARVIVQEQPAVVVAQPTPVVYSQSETVDVVPADLQIAAYQSQDRVIIMIGGVNRAAGFSTSITSVSAGGAAEPELLLRNLPPRQEMTGETPFTLNAAIRSKGALQRIQVRVADQVFEVPVVAVPSIS
ncbi:MAG: hypothetical protein H7Y88_03060, partial [Phycisphaerales bacterium]|nr:hypothetical protein [Phycisphaerales bacterium]